MNPLEAKVYSKVLALNIANKAATILHEELIKIFKPYVNTKAKVISNNRFNKGLFSTITQNDLYNLFKSKIPELNNPNISLTFQFHDDYESLYLIWNVLVTVIVHPEPNNQPVKSNAESIVYVATLNNDHTMNQLLPIIEKCQDFKHDEINKLKERYDELKDELDDIKKQLRPFFGFLD